MTPRHGTVTLRIGDPIPTAGLSHEDRTPLSQTARAQLVAMGAEPVETPA
jgi:hypothetical protein